MNFPDKKYSIILADCPWQYNDKLDSTRTLQYDTMPVDKLCDLPVSEIADENCFLFMWATWTHVFEAKRVMESWGFEYKTVAFVWIKENGNGSTFMGMGHYTRANSEVLLLGVKGHPKVANHGISQIVKSKIQKHSQKPDIFRSKIIQLVGDLPRIELFARTKIANWDVYGNDEKLNSQTLEEFR